MTEFYKSSGITDLAITNGVDTPVCPAILGSYQRRRFTVFLLNTGTNALTVKMTAADGSTQVVLLGVNSPGRAKSHIPWEIVAGGITAQGVGGPGLLNFEVYSESEELPIALPGPQHSIVSDKSLVIEERTV